MNYYQSILRNRLRFSHWVNNILNLHKNYLYFHTRPSRTREELHGLQCHGQFAADSVHSRLRWRHSATLSRPDLRWTEPTNPLQCLVQVLGVHGEAPAQRLRVCHPDNGGECPGSQQGGISSAGTHAFGSSAADRWVQVLQWNVTSSHNLWAN